MLARTKQPPFPRPSVQHPARRVERDPYGLQRAPPNRRPREVLVGPEGRNPHPVPHVVRVPAEPRIFEVHLAPVRVQLLVCEVPVPVDGGVALLHTLEVRAVALQCVFRGHVCESEGPADRIAAQGVCELALGPRLVLFCVGEDLVGEREEGFV